MNCSSCITAKEIYEGVRTIDQGCLNKIDRMNRILRNFYLDTVDISYNFVAQPIVSTGNVTIQTEYPIYKIFGFFGKGCDKCYIDENNKCCGVGTNMLKMYKVDWSPEVGQYKQLCDTEINANLPKLTNGFFVYSRGPLKISSMNDKICIDLSMLTGLEFYIEKFYAELDGDINTREIARQNYTEWLENIKKSSDTVTFSIEMGVANSPW